MVGGRAFTLSELARSLDAPQHKLIHLCEKGVIAPEFQDAAGRGSSRLFSGRNFLEFAIALRLRSMLPVAAVGATMHVLGEFERVLQKDLPEFSLPDNLRDEGSPDLRLIISDGTTIYFSLGGPGLKPKLFGGIPIDGPKRESRAAPRVVGTEPKQRHPPGTSQNGFGGPEGSRFVRLELSVTAIARDLPLG